jgi:hypothetical protein
MESPDVTVETPAPSPILEPKKPVLKDGYSFTGNTVGQVPVIRDARVKMKADRQLKLYSNCSCGSGKKFKFCCNGKEMVVINTGS